MQFVESVWLRRFVMHFCPRLLFPSRKQFSQEVLGKCKQRYVLPLLKDISTTSFNLWMFHVAHDVFALIINFFKKDQKPKQITIGLFEASKSTRQALAKSLTKLLIDIFQ